MPSASFYPIRLRISREAHFGAGKRAARHPLFPTHGEIVELSRYDGKSFAIVLQIQGRAQVLRGMARYDRDEILGNILRVEVAGEECGQPAFVLAEDKWTGSILPGNEYDCDFCVHFVL